MASDYDLLFYKVAFKIVHTQKICLFEVYTNRQIFNIHPTSKEFFFYLFFLEFYVIIAFTRKQIFYPISVKISN